MVPPLKSNICTGEKKSIRLDIHLIHLVSCMPFYLLPQMISHLKLCSLQLFFYSLNMFCPSYSIWHTLVILTGLSAKLRKNESGYECHSSLSALASVLLIYSKLLFCDTEGKITFVHFISLRVLNRKMYLGPVKRGTQ